MRQIGVIDDRQQAGRFAAYLVAQGVSVHADQEQDGWAIWVRDEDKVDQAKEELARFRHDPENDRYQGAERKAQKAVQDEVHRRLEQQRKQVDMRQQWNRPPMQRRPITMLLVMVSVGVFFMLALNRDSADAWRRNLATVDHVEFNNEGRNARDPWEILIDIRRGEVWRLVTPVFVHLGVMHLLFNMFMLYALGGMVEESRGRLRYGLMVLVLAVASSTLPALVPTEWGGSPLGFGMSGVVYGIFGYIWIKMLYQPSLGIGVHGQTVAILMIWFFLGVFGVLEDLLGIRIDNWGHGVGLVLGMILAYLGMLLSNRRRAG